MPELQRITRPSLGDFSFRERPISERQFDEKFFSPLKTFFILSSYFTESFQVDPLSNPRKLSTNRAIVEEKKKLVRESKTSILPPCPFHENSI